MFVVGTDVGMNTIAPKLLIERCGMAVDAAGFGSSVYFACRTVGAFVGTALLAKYSPVKFFRINILISSPCQQVITRCEDSDISHSGSLHPF